MLVWVAHLVANKTDSDKDDSKFTRTTFKRRTKYLSLTIDLRVSYKKPKVLLDLVK
jgi:hypothetical protein